MTKKCDYGVLDVFLVLNVIIEWFDDYIIPICQLYYVKKKMDLLVLMNNQKHKLIHNENRFYDNKGMVMDFVLGLLMA